MSEVSKVDNDFNIKIPDEIIKKAGLKPGTEVIWINNEEYNQIIITEKPLEE
jgi:bifunctional DNA-binding transcriptional regulator/antitoxin component of YhaV-PrlF toxin-antitoxin module